MIDVALATILQCNLNRLIVNRPIVHLLVLAHNYNLNIFDTNI